MNTPRTTNAPLSDDQATAAIDALRLAQDAAQGFSGAPGIKALVRRFGEAVYKHFGVASLDCAKVSGKGSKLTLKRRVIAVDGTLPMTEEVLVGLGAALGASGSRLAEVREGLAHVNVEGRDLAVTLIEDAHSPEGCLVFWESAPEATESAGRKRLNESMLEYFVKAMQSESRSLKTLDRTQAMLYKDDLTGLYNYRYLEIALDAELRRADRFQTQFCLLFLDLDGFKPINDQHGHVAGSAVLKQVADVLQDAVREVDVAIRYGGDEFVVVLLGASCAKAVLAAERVRRRIEQKEFVLDGGATARVTASIGVAAFPDHGRDRETLLKMADETMYDSKRAGKNRVTVVGGERTV